MSAPETFNGAAFIDEAAQAVLKRARRWVGHGHDSEADLTATLSEIADNLHEKATYNMDLSDLTETLVSFMPEREELMTELLQNGVEVNGGRGGSPLLTLTMCSLLAGIILNALDRPATLLEDARAMVAFISGEQGVGKTRSLFPALNALVMTRELSFFGTDRVATILDEINEFLIEPEGPAPVPECESALFELLGHAYPGRLAEFRRLYDSVRNSLDAILVVSEPQCLDMLHAKTLSKETLMRAPHETAMSVAKPRKLIIFVSNYSLPYHQGSLNEDLAVSLYQQHTLPRTRKPWEMLSLKQKGTQAADLLGRWVAGGAWYDAWALFARTIGAARNAERNEGKLAKDMEFESPITELIDTVRQSSNQKAITVRRVLYTHDASPVFTVLRCHDPSGVQRFYVIHYYKPTQRFGSRRFGSRRFTFSVGRPPQAEVDRGHRHRALTAVRGESLPLRPWTPPAHTLTAVRRQVPDRGQRGAGAGRVAADRRARGRAPPAGRGRHAGGAAAPPIPHRWLPGVRDAQGESRLEPRTAAPLRAPQPGQRGRRLDDQRALAGPP